ncbi:hypothetical protein B0H67DRAFT_670284 [Lasiosphaeris hirsuta]|uniref:Uncharacterized protein n=1 Tax=Lasiosphaeris hirsuta TaxID=260670 RepID=A0AA40A161_9PEZI|nr:hypothetical protein B0H67DRAFT_670284 [Lasiosphaeris hirsuta]
MLLPTIFLVAVAWVRLALAVGARDPNHDGGCQCAAVDYADAGSYLVDANNDGNFSYASEFSDPDDNEYDCSAISPGPGQSVQISECDMPYYDMKSGTWQIYIKLPSNITVTRTFFLTVGAASTVVTTLTVQITPTVIIGITSILPAETIKTTAHEVQTTTLAGALVTTPCVAPSTQTTTTRLPAITIVHTQTVVELTTDGKVTSSTVTTSIVTASCSYSSKNWWTTSKTTTAKTTSSTKKTSSTLKTTAKTTSKTTSIPKPTSTAAGGYTFTLSNSACSLNFQSVGGWRGGGLGGARTGPPAWITSAWAGGVPPFLTAGGALPSWVSCAAIKTRRAVAVPKVMAPKTSTVTQTTYTATKVTTSFVAARTVTAVVVETERVTITAAPTTVCVEPGAVVETFTQLGPVLTRITLVTSVSHVTETVFIA